jgi:oligopeptide/dipeptide ABC transporter ATP-binding protein
VVVTTSKNQPIIELRDVVKTFRVRGRGQVRALDGINLQVSAGETLGIVGESGCGKSTTARLLVGLERPSSGSVRIGGKDVVTGRGRGTRAQRRVTQMVFQDPYASLNPRMRVGEAIEEVLQVHAIVPPGRRRERAQELLAMVGLPPALAGRLPHQLSGGQRQRVGIARALAVEPQVLVLDEPVSALDVSVRAEIMNLLTRLRAELQLTYVFISHDLGMVRHLADTIAVMYLGQIVEYGPWDLVSDRPRHPYALGLHEAVPVADPVVEAQRGRLPVLGEVPDAAAPPPGCRFHPRCPRAEDICRQVLPALEQLPDERGPARSAARGAGPRTVACHVVHREATAAVAPPLGGAVR